MKLVSPLRLAALALVAALSLSACATSAIPAGTQLAEHGVPDQHGQYVQLELTENSALGRTSSTETFLDPNLRLGDAELESAVRFAVNFVLSEGIDSPLVFDTSPQTAAAWLSDVESLYTPAAYALVQDEMAAETFSGVENHAYRVAEGASAEINVTGYNLESPRVSPTKLEVWQVSPGPLASNTTAVQIGAEWAYPSISVNGNSSETSETPTHAGIFTLFLSQGGLLEWQIFDYHTELLPLGTGLPERSELQPAAE